MTTFDLPSTAKAFCEWDVARERRSPRFSLNRWLLDYGEEFEGRLRPDWLERMEPSMCFRNALETVLAHSGLIYCEGLIFSREEVPLLVHHAWCVDGDGKVHEPTLAQRDEPNAMEPPTYFGVQVPDTNAILGVVVETETYGLLYKEQGRRLAEKPANERGPAQVD